MSSERAEAPLPAELAEAVRRVRDDREHGASWLARATARALADASQPGAARDAGERLETLRTAAVAFVAARPSMAAVANSAAHIWAAAELVSDAAQARLQAVHDTARALLQTWDNSAAAVLAAARPLLAGTVLTHSRSGTVEAVLKQLVAGDGGDGAGRNVIVTESRPGGEGVALARSLADAGWQVTLIADAASGSFMRDAGAVVLGADSVREDGSVVNKIGSYLVALAAREAQVPVYVLCETLKIAAPDFPLVFEEMDPAELLSNATPGITPRNIYFDRTPAGLVTHIITERGILSREFIQHIALEASAALRLLEGAASQAQS